MVEQSRAGEVPFCFLFVKCSVSQQLRVLPTYQSMMGRAHEMPEGQLLFIREREEVYVRVRNGFRRVLVSSTLYVVTG